MKQNENHFFGKDSERPHSAPIGSVYSSTDVNKTYIYRNTGWTELGGINQEGSSRKIIIEGIEFEYRPSPLNDTDSPKPNDKALNNWINNDQYAVRMTYMGGDPSLLSSWSKDVLS